MVDAAAEDVDVTVSLVGRQIFVSAIGVLMTDGVVVNRPGYEFDQWANVRAVFDIENRTVRGFFNVQLMGDIRFTSGIDNEIAFVNMSLASSQPIPSIIACFDDVSVTASPLPKLSNLTAWVLAIALVFGYGSRP